MFASPSAQPRLGLLAKNWFELESFMISFWAEIKGKKGKKGGTLWKKKTRHHPIGLFSPGPEPLLYLRR